MNKTNNITDEIYSEVSSILAPERPILRNKISEPLVARNQLIEEIFSQVKFYDLDKEFYSGIRSELTKSRLKLLDAMAEKIPEPVLYGTFYDDDCYLLTLELLLKATDETKHRLFFFLKKVMPLVAKKEKLLDVGVGDGVLIKHIGKLFKHVTVIDNSLSALENITRNDLDVHAGLMKIHDSILNVELPINTYDLVVFSHVLYYVDYQHWLKVVKHAYEALKIGGSIIIVINGELDKFNLVRHFGGTVFDINLFAQQCSHLFQLHLDVFTSTEVFRTKNINPMLHIAGLHLYDYNATAKKDELLNYLSTNIKVSDNCYELTVNQKFILIHK